MTDNLHRKTVRALVWSFLETVAHTGVQFIVGIVLARLLFPEQFGLIGMLAIFIAVIRVFLDSGFGAALIQKKEITRTDICSVFYFNIAIGLAAAGLLCLAAPWIADFYNQPILAPLTMALSATIVINSFGMIQKTLLTRQIDFKAQTKVSLAAAGLSGIIGIAMAALGYGVWSLVAQQIAAAFFSTFALWVLSSWRPAPVFSFSALKGMFGFGSRLMFSSLLNQIFENIYLVVIGKLFSPADLGFFTRAKTLNDLPSQTLSTLVARVTFPVFSTIQDEPLRLKRGLKKAVTTLVMVNFPVMIGLAVIAHPLVLVMLTEKWLDCVPYFQLLCIGGLLFPLHVMNLNVLQAKGRSDLFLKLEIIKKVMIVINIAITWRWGISAMIYGMIATSAVAYYMNSYYTGALVNYPMREQLLDLFPYLAASVLMGGVVYAAGLPQYPNQWLLLLAQISAGSAVYVLICRVFRLTAFMELWQAVWDRMPLAKAGAAR